MKIGRPGKVDVNVGLYRLLVVALLLFGSTAPARAEDGYELWLRYQPVTNFDLLRQYRDTVNSVLISGDSPTMRAVSTELSRGLRGLLGVDIPAVQSVALDGVLIAICRKEEGDARHVSTMGNAKRATGASRSSRY